MKRPLCFICVIYLAVQCAFICTESRTDEKENTSALSGTLSVPDGYEADKISASGTVERIEEKKKVYAVFLENCRIEISGQNFSEPELLVYLEMEHGQAGIKIGNRILVKGEAEAFQKARNPGNFDQKFYYEKRGIRLLVRADRAHVTDPETDHVKNFLHELRSEWKKRLTRHLGEYYGGTMSAILLGEKSGLDEEMKKIYQKNGIGHILAISGLHMSFIGSGLYGLLRRAGLPFSGAAVSGGAILILYTVMIGGSVSAVRALLMFLIRAGADVSGRDYDLLTGLSVSAAAVCVWQPLNLLDAAFLLSYGAILGIALYSPVFEDMFGLKRRTGKEKTGGKNEKWKNVTGKLLSGLSSSLAVTFFLMGPVLYYYFEVPPYSAFLNLFVIPVMPFVMGAGLLGSFLTMFCDPLGGLVLKGCMAALIGYDGACGLAGSLPGSRFVTGRPPRWWLALYYGAAVLLYLLHCFMKAHRRRKQEERTFRERRTEVRCTGILLLCLGASMPFVCRAWHTYQGELQITVMDVGQGDGIFIRSDSGKCFFIDGGSSDVSSVGTYRIEPFLLAEGADTLEYVFLSHGDGDHLNGIKEMLENQETGIRIRTLVFPPEQFLDETLLETARIAVENDTNVVTAKPGDSIRDRAASGWFRLVCLAPEETLPAEKGSNSASMVLELTYGEFSMLFTGDLEGMGEKMLTDSGRLGRYTILKAAHHGSSTSGSEAFLEQINPRAAIISAGQDNRYGHPHKETIERLKAAGCSIYSTQESGALTVRTDGRTARITGFLRPAAD